jgi:ribosome-associated protein
MPEQHNDAANESPSRSQLKRDNQKLQQLGQQLVAMPDSQLQKLHLEESLKVAVYEAHRLKNPDAKRRQIQYIGKLLRSADLSQIEMGVDRLNHQSHRYRQHLAQLENWRQRIIEEGNTGIEAFMQQYPEADRQQLRNLQRQADRELRLKKTPSASRKLFSYLRGLTD